MNEDKLAAKVAEAIRQATSLERHFVPGGFRQASIYVTRVGGGLVLEEYNGVMRVTWGGVELGILHDADYPNVRPATTVKNALDAKRDALKNDALDSFLKS